MKTAAIVSGGLYGLATLVLAAVLYRSSLSDPFWNVDGLTGHLWMLGFSALLAGGICAPAVLLPAVGLSACYVAAVSVRARSEQPPHGVVIT